MGLINAIACNKNALGLGLVGCQPFLTEFKTPILVKKGWSMLRTDFEDMVLADFTALIQTDVWEPVLGTKGFTNNTPETTTEEYSGGVMAVVRNAKPLYQFDYNKGIAFHKALSSKNSFQEYDVILVDSSDTMVLALSPDGLRVTGLSASMVNTATFTPTAGDTSANTALTIQLDNEIQFNTRMAIYTAEQSGVSPNTEFLPIANVTITGTATAGDPINVFVSSGQNVSFGVQGLLATDFRVVNTATNTVMPIATATAGTNEGDYVITLTTPTTLGQTITVQTYDATLSVGVAALADNSLYEGISDTITVAA